MTAGLCVVKEGLNVLSSKFVSWFPLQIDHTGAEAVK